MALGTDNCYPLIPGGVAVAAGDFMNIATNNAADGVYTLNGQTVPITDIIDVGNPNGNFDPAIDIDADGIKAREVESEDPNFGASRSIILQPSLSASLLAEGYTFVIEYFMAEGTVGNFDLIEFSEDFEFDVSSASARHDSVKAYTEQNGNEFAPDTAPTLDAVNKLAGTITGTGVSLSLNGAPTFHSAGTTDLSHFDLVRFETPANLTARLRSFAFYDLVDDADLPTLSAL